MRRLVVAAICVLCASLTSVSAQQRETIGKGRLFSNDYLGDQHDRWRTGSYVFSLLRGRNPYEGTTGAFGDIIEYRFRSEIIAPEIGSDTSGVRPFVGALSIGAHTHFRMKGADATFGADLTAIGPQTRLGAFQDGFHELFRLPQPSQADELDDAFFLSGTASVSKTIPITHQLTFRPFAEAQVGVEDIVRIGGDILVGQVGTEDLMLRDVVTGQLYRGTRKRETGVSYVFGADIAAVSDSVFLPEGEGYLATDTRTRARAGVHFQVSDEMSMFYGMTYLSEEFEGQPNGQLLGSLNLNFNF